MFIADLHLHSNFSDGSLAIPEIVDLYGARGFGAIAITDHLCESRTVLGKAAVYMNRSLTPAVFPLYMEILKSEAMRAWKQYKMVLIPGIEVTKSRRVANHHSARVLGLGIKEFVSADARIKDICTAIRAQGAIAVAGSTKRLWDRRNELRDSFDAWETTDGRKLMTDVMKSEFPKLATSGLHKPKHLNSWKTVFKCDRDPQAILHAIKTQDIAFTYYDEATNDIFEFVNVRDLGINGLNHPDRYRLDVGSLSLRSIKALRKKRAHHQTAGLDLEAAQRRRERDERESRELFPN